MLAASISFVAGSVGMLALLAVFVFWGAGDMTDALPYFAVPGALFALSSAFGAHVWRVDRHVN